ncbi:hypothetical protein ABBQ38_001398 [Trebouxia sp. C0009 RCD-2024]
MQPSASRTIWDDLPHILSCDVLCNTPTEVICKTPTVFLYSNEQTQATIKHKGTSSAFLPGWCCTYSLTQPSVLQLVQMPCAWQLLQGVEAVLEEMMTSRACLPADPQVQVLHAGIIALVDGRLAIYCAMARAQTPSLRVGLDKGFHEHGLMRQSKAMVEFQQEPHRRSSQCLLQTLPGLATDFQ